MALVLPNSIFLHIPKTGGVWVRNAIRNAGIPTCELGEQHTHFPDLLQYRDDIFYHNKTIFTFIRHPISWYQSRWVFRMRNGWRMSHPLDYNCASNNFRTFVENCLLFCPTGWVAYEYNNYIIDDMVIGKQESLADDLVNILNKAGERFNEKKLRTTPLANESVLDGKGSSFWAIYTDELRAKVIQVEHEIIERYYD